MGPVQIRFTEAILSVSRFCADILADVGKYDVPELLANIGRPLNCIKQTSAVSHISTGGVASSTAEAM